MRYRDVDWDLAACAGLEGRLWFPDQSMGGAVPEIVKRICRGCDIQPDCLQYAVDNDEFGYWGGQYFVERKVDGQAGVNPEILHTTGDGDNVPQVQGASIEEVPSGEREHDGTAAVPSSCDPG